MVEKEDIIDFSKLSHREILVLLYKDVDHIKATITKIYTLELKIQALELSAKNNSKYFGMIASFILSVISAVIISKFLK